MKLENRADDLYIDLAELLSRKVVDTTINDIVLETKPEKGAELKQCWKIFLDALKNNNEIKKVHKTDAKYKSKYGKSIVGFDIYNNKPLIWFSDLGDNTTLRINGQKEYAIQCNRTYSTYNGNPILRNKLTITDKSINYLFMGCFGIEQEQIKKANELKPNQINKRIMIKKNWIPAGYASILIPDYIIDNYKVGRWEHNYGVLPVMEMLNKDFIDDDNVIDTSAQSLNDLALSDWWVARDFIEYFNGFFRFIANELILDHTRIIGTFSQQEINNLNNNSVSTNTMELLRKIDNSRVLQSALGSMITTDNNILAKKLIIKSFGGEGALLEKMQTTFKAAEYSGALEDKISLFFKMCGYNWSSGNDSIYENVSQTTEKNKGVFETTKEKVSLFERQWTEFYCRLAYAYFKNVLKRPFFSFNECVESFKEFVDFRIVSNVVIKENSDYRKAIELNQNGLMSKKQAIATINPDWEPEQVEKELLQIQQEELDNEASYYSDETIEKFNKSMR